MSQIDQAFIQAYADEDTVSSPPANRVLPIAAEPMPAPHFRILDGSHAFGDTAAMQRALLAPGAAEEPIENTTERRPLSTFAVPEQAPTTTFQPVFEVDAFRWPEVVGKLSDANEVLLTPVVQQLLAASEEGRSMVGIAGLRSGVGCSTVLMCLARRLAEAGKTVVMVDGNFASCTLAKSLGLEFDTGWEDVLSGQVPLAESVVRSIDDQIALLPLRGVKDSPTELLASIQTSVSAGVLRYHYDIVLFDLGAPNQGIQQDVVHEILKHCRIDASIIVADTSTNDMESGRQVDQLMSLLGPPCLGLIGNVPGCLQPTA